MTSPSDADALAGCLLGTAVGDALGLPAEGLSAATVARRFGALDRYQLLGQTGFVSDDTEQAALVVQSVLRGGGDVAASTRHFRRALVGWFWRLPFGLGLATLRAGLRATLGLQRSGVNSAGNGAAMRAAVLGLLVKDAPHRRELGRALASVTHVDPRAVEAAVWIADAAAALRSAEVPAEALRHALEDVQDPQVRSSVQAGLAAASDGRDAGDAGKALGNTGFVIHTVALVAFCVARHGDAPMDAVRSAIRAGGDTDTHAAMVGALCGARSGPAAWPVDLVERLCPGPFGRAHLLALSEAGATFLRTGKARAPGYLWPSALLRNLALYPVILAHGFRRLWPW